MKEILKNLVETTTLPEDSYLDQDSEILEIFVEEIEEIFGELDNLLSDWLDKPQDKDLLTTIRRHFHTLKGSGRMVGAKTAGEAAWTVEDTLNRVIGGSLTLSPTIQQYAQTVLNIYQYKLYPSFKNVTELTIDLRPIVLLGQQIQHGQSPEPALQELLALAHSLKSSTDVTGLELDTVETTEATEFEIPDLAAIELPTEDNLLQETVAIFIEEAEEHLQTIENFLKQEDSKSQDYNGLIRALHTLRGSSSMAQIDQIFEASSKVENLFKTQLQEEIGSTSKETALLIQYSEFVRDFLHTLRQGETSQLNAIYNTFNDAWNDYGFASEGVESDIQPQGLVSKLIELNIDLLLDAEFEFDTRAKAEFPEYLQTLSTQADELLAHTDNRASVGIHQFTTELKSGYDNLRQKPQLLNLDYAYELFAQAHQEFIHLFDTLAAGQRVVLSDEAQKLLSDLTAFVQQDIEDTAEASNVLPTLATHLEVVPNIASIAVEASNTEPTAQAETSTTGIDFATLSQKLTKDRSKLQSADSNTDFDPDLLEIFLEEADELLAGIDSDLNTWNKDLADTRSLNNLMRYLHTLKGGANMISATHIGLIAHELESIYERVIRGQIQATVPLVQVIRLVQDDISDRIQTIRESGIDYPATEAVDILTHIHGIVQGQVESGTTAVSTPEAVEVEPNVASVEELPTVEVEFEAPTVSIEAIEFEAPADIQPVVEAVASNTTAEPKAEDDELRSVVEETFLEEAEEILEQAAELLIQWFDQRSDRSILLQLQRAAHSIKGGARMVENEPVAAVAYQLETTFEQFAVHHFNSNVYDDLLQTTLSWLKQGIFEKDYSNFDSIKRSLESIEYVDVTAQLPSRRGTEGQASGTRSFEFIQGDGVEPPSMQGEWTDTLATDNSNEMIRISADLVEKMIDLSGENSINRSRIEMDLGQLGNTLNEMELAIKRLADQLRRMDGELESQILAKHGTENSRYADFDPLEMDQYSSLNQLSKSLAESASDLVDFKSTLSEKIRDTEGLLLQQSRIQAEIQESLMRTRLVPFSRMLPRLQRIVRQTSTTLNRPAELVVQNTEGELDRTILERLVTPFEHMLRNAIDHGLEETTDRIVLNKPEVGHIVLNISRQGTDVLVSFSDDGKGIDESKIKEKALSQGLIKADQALDKQEILQMIFHPGFSTAKEVTQISGRGVGLDVVQSEIKALGGHVSVESELGKGTTFTIRVPTTVAVSDALMVKVGDQQFAISLAQIDRIVRISPSALESYFNSKADTFKIDNENYKLRYLSEFVSNQPVPRLSNVSHSLPVLLIKGNSGQTIALLVDQLIGSRAQIVVKPIGQQFSSIGAIAGATILGDGQVCLILDGQNIARQIQTTQRLKNVSDSRELGRHGNARRLVMIVDDSVTVRKVTSRLLERQGYDIITAKDGVDAIEQLENVRPDLMLLDIEMPRMDGFEVTNLVRHHEIHKELPIIMITSRTGEKHRERAFSLGVSHYMGKPFQEAELLANIEALIAEKQELIYD